MYVERELLSLYLILLELLTIYHIPPSVSEKVSEMFGGSAVLARSISHHAEFVKPPAPKNS